MSVHDRYRILVKDQRSFFDELVTLEWETYLSAEWDAMRRYEVASLFNIIKPSNVLDIGCGCGFRDQVMAEYPFVDSVHAFDYSAKSVEKANSAYPHLKVQRWCADLYDTEPAPEYDLVVSFQVIEHLEEPRDYFKIARGFCKPKGFLAVFTPNRNRLSNLLLRLRGKKPILCDPQHFREFTRRELVSDGESCGLKMEASFGYILGGLTWVDRQPIDRRLVWGTKFPFMASGLAVIFSVL